MNMTTVFRANQSGEFLIYEGVKRGLSHEVELMYRQQCAQMIQEIGVVHRHMENLQLTINAAITFMHHFYIKFSPVHFKPIFVAMTSFYIACKVRDNAKKAEYILEATCKSFNLDLSKPDIKKKLVHSIHTLEGIMLLSVGFENIYNEQPWDYLLPLLISLKAPKSVMIASSYISTNMLLLTTLCLRYDPSLLAAASFSIAAKWHGLNIDMISKGGLPWYYLIKCKKTVNINSEVINIITDEFLHVYKNAPMLIHGKLNHNHENHFQSSNNNNNDDGRSPSIHHFDSKNYINSRSVTPSHILSRSTTPVNIESSTFIKYNGRQEHDPNYDPTLAESFESNKGATESPQKNKKSSLSVQEYLSRKKSTNLSSHRSATENGLVKLEHNKSHSQRDSTRNYHPDKKASDKVYAGNSDVSRDLKSSPHPHEQSRLHRAHTNSSAYKSDSNHHSHSSSSRHHSHHKPSNDSRSHPPSSGSVKHHHSSKEHKETEQVKKEKRHRQDSSSGNEHSSKRHRSNSQSSTSSHKHSRHSSHSHSYERRSSHIHPPRNLTDSGKDNPPPVHNGNVTLSSKEKSGAYDPADHEFTDLF